MIYAPARRGHRRAAHGAGAGHHRPAAGHPAPSPLPIREAQTLAMELLFQRRWSAGLEGAVLASPTYRRYAEQRERGLGAMGRAADGNAADAPR
jgi:hypothetical protein